MGIFDFVKSVGKKLGIGADDEATPPDAAALKKELDSHKLGTEKIAVEVRGDTAVIKGEVADQTAFEKAIIAVGNTLGIGKVETDVKIAQASATVPTADAAAAAPKEPVFYTVKKGDNLWKIAEHHYGKGKGTRHNVIFEANKPMLKSPDLIYPGQVLRIPELQD